jgi:enoyl-CoA hydratase
MQLAVPNAFTFDLDDDGIGLFRIERPEKLNALTRPVLAGIAESLDIAEREHAHMLIFTGSEERAFCAGTDLGELQGMTRDARMEKNHTARQLMFRISRSPILTMAALNGLAYGGGLELAMACEFRIAAAHVKVSLPEIKLGLIPAYGGTQFLPLLVGKYAATEMMLTGRAVQTDEALRIGLINRIATADSSLLEQARDYAMQMAVHSRPARDAIRACVEQAGSQVTQAGLDFEDQLMREVFETEDAAEGVQAFLEKRAPVYRHR